MNLRGTVIGTALLLVTSALPLDARLRVQFDALTARYTGFIDWKNSSTDSYGTQTETVRARVEAGKVFCDVGFVSPDHRAGTQGPGLLEISLELAPDPGDTLGPGGVRRPAPTGRMYSFRIACPNAESSDSIRAARWSHMMDSYKQTGGQILYDSRTAQRILPELKGTWTELFNDPNGGNSSSTLAWHLCAGACQLPPPPRPPPLGIQP